MKTQNILIDTNILIYYFRDNTDFHKISVSILENEKYKLFITTKNISELFVVLTKQQISWDNILLFFEDLQHNCTILCPTQNSLNKFKDLCIKHKPHRNKVFDMEIASIMLANNINTIATFNHKDFAEIDEIEILEDCF
jgi:predicted nucleic acid-binding protein